MDKQDRLVETVITTRVYTNGPMDPRTLGRIEGATERILIQSGFQEMVYGTQVTFITHPEGYSVRINDQGQAFWGLDESR